MRPNAWMANRQGAPPVNTLAWLGVKFSLEGVNCPWHIKKEVQQDYIKIEGPTPGFPVTTPHELSPPLHTASSLRPATAPATSCWGSPWHSGQTQPCIKQVHHHPRLTGHLSTTSHCRDLNQADQSLPISQEVSKLHTLLPTRSRYSSQQPCPVWAVPARLGSRLYLCGSEASGAFCPIITFPTLSPGDWLPWEGERVGGVSWEFSCGVTEAQTLTSILLLLLYVWKNLASREGSAFTGFLRCHWVDDWVWLKLNSILGCCAV